MTDRVRHSPAALRNREPILAVLKRLLPSKGTLLEIASGNGEHAAFIAPRLSASLIWQPSEANADALADIDAHTSDAKCSNIRPAILLNACAADWLPQDVISRLHLVERDLISLTDFESHLANKVQFLLDAILGFINTEQNEIFKVLTIAAVVGIPPTLIASMYGMNFRNMPELSWSRGYEWGLALIAISTITPILWFKSRGWW